MTLSLPSGSFSFGTSETVVGGGGIDMSLGKFCNVWFSENTVFHFQIVLADDIIASRRKQSRSVKTQQNRRKNQVNKKSVTSTTATATQKAVGRAKASKQAAADKRRGLRGSNKPSAMEVGDQVNRQKKKDFKKKKVVNSIAKKKGNQPNNDKKLSNMSKEQREAFRQTERQANSLKKIAEKAISKAKEKPINNRRRNGNHAPSKEAVNAAVAALQLSGYRAPEGMKMVIKFEQNSDRGDGRYTKPAAPRSTNKGRGAKPSMQTRSRNDGYQQARRGGGGTRGRAHR